VTVKGDAAELRVRGKIDLAARRDFVVADPAASLFAGVAWLPESADAGVFMRAPWKDQDGPPAELMSRWELRASVQRVHFGSRSILRRSFREATKGTCLAIRWF